MNIWIPKTVILCCTAFKYGDGTGPQMGAKNTNLKGNGGQNICNRVASVGNGKNFEKQAQSSKG